MTDSFSDLQSSETRPVSDFYSLVDNRLSFSRQQASDFAKQVAGDFNPIHDIDAARFCVPGDLLFAVLLQQYGLSRDTRVTFEGMVTDATELHFPKELPAKASITDQDGKVMLLVERDDEVTRDTDLINALTTQYVKFSGLTFPDILVELMRENDVMINPARPLVIYRDMRITLDRLDLPTVELHYTVGTMNVEGKKGQVELNFELRHDGAVVGRGLKTMVLGGLRAYDQEAINGIVSDYLAMKSAFE